MSRLNEIAERALTGAQSQLQERGPAYLHNLESLALALRAQHRAKAQERIRRIAPHDPELLDLRETAQLLRCSRTTLYRRTRGIPSVKVGAHRMFRTSDLIDWMVNGHNEKPTDAL